MVIESSRYDFIGVCTTCSFISGSKPRNPATLLSNSSNAPRKDEDTGGTKGTELIFV
jgi:hypothetical protein